MDSAAPHARLAQGTSRAVAEGKTTSLARLLLRVDGLPAGWLGALWLGFITVGDRLLRVPALYERPGDVVTHLAAEVSAGACVWTVVWLVLGALGRVLDGFGPNLRMRGRMAKLSAVVLGGVAGAVECGLIVRYSTVWPYLPSLVWWLLSALAGAGVVLGLRWLLRRTLPLRVAPLGMLLLGLVVVPTVWSLERYVRHYGRLLGLVQLGIACLAAVGVRLLFARMSSGRRLQLLASSLVVASLAWVFTATPSFSSRRAVLVWGGMAKQLTLDVLWPLLDRDGDRVPSSLWGTDPDNRDPRLGPVPRWNPPPAPASAAAVPSPPDSARRELLVIVVDTTRRDSFERLLAEDATIRRAFSSFTYFASYESCSTRTDQVLYQLFGPARCDPRRLPGGASLLDVLRRAGYREQGLRYYAIPLGLADDRIVKDDAKLLSAARLAIEAPRGAPRLLLVHLRGGHAPYGAPGATPRERYDAHLRRALASVGELVAAAPPERYSVVVLGDHGEAFGEHLSYAHGITLYQELLETPFLVRSPALTPGRRTEPVGCVDVAWEGLRSVGLAEAAPPPLGFHYATLDLLPGQLGGAQRERLRSLRVGDKKAIFSPQIGVWELYDLARDPHEEVSLAEREPETLAPLRADLMKLVTECRAAPYGVDALE